MMYPLEKIQKISTACLGGVWGGTKVEILSDDLFEIIEMAVGLHVLIGVLPKCEDCPPESSPIATWMDSEHTPCCAAHARDLRRPIELPYAKIVSEYNEWLASTSAEVTVDVQLREALQKGKEDYEANKQDEREKTRQDAEARMRRAREQEAYWRKRIREEPPLLFEKIREAVAKGKKEIEIGYGDESLVTVLREIDGLKVTYASGERNINSDEVKEPYFDITVTWKDPP